MAGKAINLPTFTPFLVYKQGFDWERNYIDSFVFLEIEARFIMIQEKEKLKIVAL